MSCSSPSSMDSWSGGMSTTTKVVLAVLLGVALVLLFAWLLCPCPSDRRGDCHDRRYRDNCGWSSGSADDCCDDDYRCVIVTPAPAPACHPSKKRHCKDDNCGWSGSTDDCGWSGSGNACRSPRKRRHC